MFGGSVTTHLSDPEFSNFCRERKSPVDGLPRLGRLPARALSIITALMCSHGTDRR